MSKKKIILIEGVPSDRDLDRLAGELLANPKDENEGTSEEESNETG